MAEDPKDKARKPSENDKRFTIRRFGKTEVSLKDIENNNLGLYFPLNQMSEIDKTRLAVFLGEIELQPIALAHSAATDDDD